jgi:hypothetical protein
MENTRFLDKLDTLFAAGNFIENNTQIAIVKNVLPALVISNYRENTLSYEVSVYAHVKSINGVCHYMTKWVWELNNITNIFWITEESCKNNFVITLIFKYKELNKL